MTDRVMTHRDYYKLTDEEKRLGENITEADFWRVYGREMAEADGVGDIERTRYREAQEALGIGSYPFAEDGEEACRDMVGPEE